MKLTWNQRRALEISTAILTARRRGCSLILRSEIYPYLCGAAARSAVMALVRKGFAEVSDAGSPMRYRITPIGRAALEKEKRA